MKKLVLLGMSMFLLGACGNNSDIEAEPSEEVSSEQVESVSEVSVSNEVDPTEFNGDISDSLIESQQFNAEGTDGYEWSYYVSNLEIQDSGALYITVIDDFYMLDSTEQQSVLKSAESSANTVVFTKTENENDLKRSAKAYDESGQQIAEKYFGDEFKFE